MIFGYIRYWAQTHVYIKSGSRKYIGSFPYKEIYYIYLSGPWKSVLESIFCWIYSSYVKCGYALKPKENWDGFKIGSSGSIRRGFLKFCSIYIYTSSSGDPIHHTCMVENQRKFRKLRLKEDFEAPIFCVDSISCLLSWWKWLQ